MQAIHVTKFQQRQQQLPSTMENSNAQTHQPGQHESEISSHTAPIPTVDLKAPLKIEEDSSTASPNEPQVNYGEKLFLFGIIFCGILVGCVAIIAYLWTQNSNQSQRVITVEQTNH